jgi:hypothetical protein
MIYHTGSLCISFTLFSFFFLFLAISLFELRVLPLLSRLSTAWAMLPALFALVFFFFNRVSYLWPGQPGPPSSCLQFPCSWDDRHVCHHTQLHWLRWGLEIFLPGLASNHLLSDLCLMSRMRHHAWLLFILKKWVSRKFFLSFSLLLFLNKWNYTWRVQIAN